MREEIADVRRLQIFRVAFPVEVDVALDPIDIRLLGADGIMFVTANVANGVQQFGLVVVGTGRYGAVHEAVAYQTQRPNASRIRRLLVAFNYDFRSSNLSSTNDDGRL